MQRHLRESIIQTLAYFDIFDFPLTKEELYHRLWKYEGTLAFADFLRILREFPMIEHKDGYYALPGRSRIVEERKCSRSIIEKKMKIAKRAAKKVRWVPFVRALFVCNTVASAGASDESDIDVFIVIKNRRLWIARFLITILLSLFRLRRTKTDVANKICLSFYVTDRHLNLEDIAIDGEDIYLMYWIDQLIPIYDPEDIRAHILRENRWVKPYLPHAFQSYRMLPDYRVDRGKGQSAFRRAFEKMWGGAYGDMLEHRAKRIQEKKMSRNYESIKNEPDTRVVIDDTMLKFHENDRRALFREEWKKRYAPHIESLT